VVTPVQADNSYLAGPLNGVDADLAAWLPAPVPARASTWSALKARFR